MVLDRYRKAADWFLVPVASRLLHVNPNLAHSYIHTHGGPVFFLLSLIPFLGLLGLLIRAESRRRKTAE